MKSDKTKFLNVPGWGVTDLGRKNINKCQTCYLDDNIPSTHLRGHWSRSLLQTGLDRPNARWCAPCSPFDHHSLLFFSHIVVDAVFIVVITIIVVINIVVVIVKIVGH